MEQGFKFINGNIYKGILGLKTANISIKILAGVVISKCIAVFIGPEGMALVGNLRNFLSILQSFSIVGLYDGLVKLIGKYKNSAFALSRTLSSLFYFGFFSTVILAFFAYFNAEMINDFLFLPNYNYTYVIKILSLVLPFYALNVFVFSIMNGFSKVKNLLIITIIGEILGLLVTLLLICEQNIDGVLIAVVLAPALSILITIVGILHRRSLVSFVKITNIIPSIFQKLWPYMLIALVSSASIPLVLIVIRNYIISEIGLKEAGYWEATNQLSQQYLMFINALVAWYIVPRLSVLRSRAAFRAEIFGFYKTIIPVFALCLFVLYLSRSFLVPMLLSETFKPVEDLLGFQMLGDIMLVLAMVMAYQFLAKRMFAHFIILQIFLVTIKYFTSVYLIDIFGLKGAVMGHCISYALYFGIVLLTFGSSLFGVLSPDEIEEKSDDL